MCDVFQTGDRVFSLIDFKKIRKGDEGTVLGPCADPNAENRDKRVSVDFGLEKGRANMLAATHIQGCELVGGYRKGDRVVSMIDFKKIRKGDEGTVLGACADPNAENRDERVSVDFGLEKGRANMIAATHIQGFVLVGGYRKGDRVVSMIDFEKIRKGDEGTVLGACADPNAENRDKRVSVDFGLEKGRANMIAATHIQGCELVGGYRKGDRVVSMIDFEKIRKGDEGTVLGACADPNAENRDKRVSVDFGLEKGRANMIVATHIQGCELVGGYRKGDRVVSMIDFEKIRKGDEGTVLGACADPNVENRDERVSVDFGLEKGRANMLAATHIQGCELVGGYRKGDRVVSMIDFEKIRKGDEGTVLGACADPNAENRDKRVSVDFGLEKGRANMLAATHIQGCELVGGYRKGDRVVSMIDFKKIRKGDEGTVLGACADPNAENRDERVSVDFGLEKGRANMIAAKHIQKADASKPAGSFGDPVGTWSAIAAHVAQPQPRLAGVLSSLSQADVKAMFNETAEPSCSVSRIEILSCSPSNSRHARMASDTQWCLVRNEGVSCKVYQARIIRRTVGIHSFIPYQAPSRTCWTSWTRDVRASWLESSRSSFRSRLLPRKHGRSRRGYESRNCLFSASSLDNNFNGSTGEAGEATKAEIVCFPRHHLTTTLMRFDRILSIM